MTWLLTGTSAVAVGLAISTAVLAIRLGGLKARALELANERDRLAIGLHELKGEIQRAELSGRRDAHVLEGKVQRCREMINALPESSFSRGLVLSQLDRVLSGETN